MLLEGLPNHQATPINTTIMSKKRHTKKDHIKAIALVAAGGAMTNWAVNLLA